MKNKFRTILPITKVDEVQRLVYGTAALEQVDKTNEILDYATSKPRFVDWSADIFKSSGGKSLGNVREMHNNKSAVGKLTIFTPNDVNKSFEVAAKVVDDQAWEKVLQGVYTGFSLGGNYERRWDDPALKGVKRYTANPLEISLVDNPCIPDATFEMIKSDGSKELRKFAPAPEPEEAKYELMRRVINASGMIGGKELAQNCIKNYYPQTVAIFKSMWSISQLADCLQSLAYIESGLESAREYDGIDTKIPEMLGSMLMQAKPIFLALAEEEISRLVREDEREAAAAKFFSATAAMEKIVSSHQLKLEKGVTADMKRSELLEKFNAAVAVAKTPEEMQKAWDDHSAALKASKVEEGDGNEDQKKKQKVDQGEGAKETDKAVTDSLNKALGVDDGAGSLKKMFDRVEKLESQNTELEKVVEQQGELLNKFVEKIIGTALPAKAAIASAPVTKNADGSAADTQVIKAAKDYTKAELEKMTPAAREELIQQQFKLVQSNPQIGQPFPTN